MAIYWRVECWGKDYNGRFSPFELDAITAAYWLWAQMEPEEREKNGVAIIGRESEIESVREYSEGFEESEHLPFDTDVKYFYSIEKGSSIESVTEWAKWMSCFVTSHNFDALTNAVNDYIFNAEAAVVLTAHQKGQLKMLAQQRVHELMSNQQ